MKSSLRLLPILLILSACGDGKTHSAGGDAGVANFPRVSPGGRLLIRQCCTFSEGPDLRMTVTQGTESPSYEIAGKGFQLEVSYDPWGSTDVEQRLYERLEDRSVDGVRLSRFRLRRDATPPYPAPPHLWTAKVGGRQIGDIFHEGWVLRIAGDCTSADACDSMFSLVSSIRF
jgi:hypothetical protein